MFWNKPQRARRREYRPSVNGLEDRCLLTTPPPGFTATTIASGLVRPSAFALAPDGRFFITQQDGKLVIVQGGRVLPTPFLTLKVDSRNERGLVGLALDPKFPKSPWVYVYYTVPSGPGTPAHNRLSRFRAAGNIAVPGSEQVLLDLPPLGINFHNAGSINFGKDGMLYLGVGDNYNTNYPQSLQNPFGKILRIRPDGTIPSDNPFYAYTTGINRAIWAYGLRNPFTTAVNPRTGLFYINDVGQDTWEEIDRGIRGANYGWPNTEGPTHAPGIIGPVYAYKHSETPELNSAITGGVFDNATRPVSQANSYYFADYTGNYIKRLDPSGQVYKFASDMPYFTLDLAIDTAGNLYALSRGTRPDAGVITRISRQPMRG